MNGLKNLVRFSPRSGNFYKKYFPSISTSICTFKFGLKQPVTYQFRTTTSLSQLRKTTCFLCVSGQSRLHDPCQRLICSASQPEAKPKNTNENHEKMEGNLTSQRENTIFELRVKTTEKPIPSTAKPLSPHELQFQKALIEARTKANFCKVLENFKVRDKTRRGHMQFLTIAMNYMDTFGLEKDLEIYNQLLDVFPRGRFENKTLFDAIWAKQHPQVFLALDILTKMEENVIKPNQETHDICYEVFGRASQPVQKCRRIAYWFTKLEEMFPHPLPGELPEDEVALSTLAMERMTKEGVHVKVYNDVAEDFIVGAQSDNQKEILANYDKTKPLYVEGPFFMWLRRLKRHYYILRADVAHKEEDNEGMVLAVCMMQAPNQEESLKAWISSLQKENPRLAHINVIFNHQFYSQNNM